MLTLRMQIGFIWNNLGSYHHLFTMKLPQLIGSDSGWKLYRFILDPVSYMGRESVSVCVFLFLLDPVVYHLLLD